MPWCPVCKTEYLPGYSTCADCEKPLVDQLPQVVKNEPREAPWVLLKQCYNDKEADVITSILEAEAIPVLRKYPGAGEYLKVAYGMNSGVQLFVPEDMAELAKELIQQPFENMEWETVETPVEEPGDFFRLTYQDKRKIALKIFIWWMVFLFLLPTIITNLVNLFS